MKNNRIVLLIALMALGTVSISYAGRVRLPGKNILTQRLKNKGFGHFIEKTEIVRDLADQEKEVLGVVLSVQLSLYDYAQSLKQSMGAKMMEKRKSQLIETILEGNSEAIKEAQDILKKIEETSAEETE